MDHNKLIQDYLKKSCSGITNSGCDAGPFMNYDTHPNLRQDQMEEAFFDRFIDKSQFLRDINTFRVSSCQGRIPRMDSCSIVTRGKCSTSNCGGSGLDLDISYLSCLLYTSPSPRD